MTPDHELWAVALWAEKRHRTDAPRFIAEQIGRLALEGDEKGVARWRAIAERLDQLQPDETASRA